MMKASELRIGNLVWLVSEGHEHEPDIVEWGIDDFEFYQDRMDDVEPIPLTEEWLKDFGFERREPHAGLAYWIPHGLGW